MHGTLDAAQRWSFHYTAVLEEVGFIVGKASPCNLFHDALGVSALVHGDDFFIVGRTEGRAHAVAALQRAYVVKGDHRRAGEG